MQKSRRQRRIPRAVIEVGGIRRVGDIVAISGDLLREWRASILLVSQTAECATPG